jgi:hypothetical protein
MCDMLRHPIEWTRDIHTKPNNLVATIIANDGELPEIVGG